MLKLGDLGKWDRKIIIKNLLENIIQSIKMMINIIMEKIHILDSHNITEKEKNMVKKDHIKISIKINIDIF